MSSELVFRKSSDQQDQSYNLAGQYSVPKEIKDGLEIEEIDPLKDKQQRLSKFERESSYHKQRYQRELSPERDPNINDEELLKIREQERNEQTNSIVLKQNEDTHEDDGSKTPPHSSDSTKIVEINQESSKVYEIPKENKVSVRAMNKSLITEVPGVKDLQFFKEQDEVYFGKLLDGKTETELSLDELKERKIMRLLLKVKNGTPPVRKVALRQITDNARSFGAKALFNQILPLLLEKTLDDQERHLLVKVVDRILYKLDDMIRPYTHKILMVISPLLIDEEYITRTEGKEIISNLSKAAGLSHMISTMRPDIDHSDEYIRNITSRSLAVVAGALGIPAMIPFLKAVCHSKKSWQARHTGMRTIQQIANISGCGVLPHLNGLVQCVSKGLSDEQLSVRTTSANALSALAQASATYGIESFETILEPLWNGIKRHRGRSLSAFLKCIGFIIPLMDPEYASYYTKEIMFILIREFKSPDDEMRKVVLKVIQQCASTDGVQPNYLKRSVLPSFFDNFWVRRMALDRQSYRLVVETSAVLSEKVGASEIVERLLVALKDESEPFRKMAVETIYKIVLNLGSIGFSERTESLLIDGLLVAFQEQSGNDSMILIGFSTVVNSLGLRCQPFIGPIVTTILHRLKNKSAEIRQQASDFIAQIAPVIMTCGEEDILNKLSVILFESLGEVYPEVLGSLLGALKNIATVVGISSMQPPVNQILPSLTPILRNRHEKVQENAIDLVGRIADRGADYVSPKEWMRICFELLDMLKSTKKGIRRAANNTFGYIAKAVGPQEVLVTLLNNLRVQERQLRVCTAVAIGIVAETCSPFTVLPALMNEYRTPEVNVQNGVLKAMTFMFEYIGSISNDYIYSITPLLEDALTDRDQVHRQTAASVVRHIALGCIGLGREDAFIHFLNLLIPNIFETSPHVINRILDGIEGVRNAVGPGLVLNYTWNGLFHPARKVRKPYWKIYNSAYVQNLDSLVPYYPLIEQEDYKIDIFEYVL
ncbi:U2 snRNP component prp10 [Wickerhamomyces ciferrii]|uniref:U2 snRNP component prp10 n=1 Tax=Wickerhamomyces ciferrii (strain ATCC 14091 / BCRC 22168 / CBS 111 / JCM 3599 / NBRC 0793 / NRRL Y-1031 F-60-10) TaxID=1206466 RepID=K0KIU5_WICCF|nr:U2 snRNP component prp10 [Wickerhamomyces ciferrii]CCH45140.1 U2 snRNP component prp10 [Wickerhamomyces ciferrii]